MNRNTWTTALVLLLLKNKTENHISKIHQSKYNLKKIASITNCY